MRTRRHAIVSVSLVLAGSLLIRGCETPTAPEAVASVSLTPAAMSLHPTQTGQLTAVVLDADGDALTGKTIAWTSSNNAAATVDNSGLVTAVDIGSATITATVDGVLGTAVMTVVQVPVDSVSIVPATANVIIGQTRQLAATPRDSVGAPLVGRVVTWSSSDLSRATVSATGLVTSVGLGAVTITATSEGVNGSAVLTIVPVPVDSVAVSPAAGSRLVGQTLQFTATTLDSVNNVLGGRVVTWSSSNTAVATVNASGLATALSAGAATITATSEGVNGAATFTVMSVPVDSVRVQPDSAVRFVGQSAQFTATTFDSVGGALTGRTVTWQTSNAGVATVSATGLATGVAAGTATITATSEGVSDTAYVRIVVVPVDSVAVAPADGTRLVGQTLQFTASALDSSNNVLTGRVVTWSSSNDAVATVSASGLATAVNVGVVTITATSEGVDGTATFTVVAVPVDSVWVQPDSASRLVGQSAQFTAATFDSVGGALAGRVITWGTSNAGVATVSASGLATGVAPGTATITATSEGVSDTAFIRILAVPVDSVAVTPGAATRYPGQTVQLSAATFDSAGAELSGRVVTWGTSNASVATVDASGLVSAVAVGSATITATSDGVDGTAAITVLAVPVASVVITPDSVGREVGTTVQFTAATLDSAGGILSGRSVTWSALDPSVATVNASGLATAVANGLGRIVATSEGRADTAKVSVTTPAGGPLVVGPFDVHATPQRDNAQGVATDGVNALYLVQTRSFDDSPGAPTLYAYLVDSSGNILNSAQSLNSNGDPPAVAYGGGTYLAVTYGFSMSLGETRGWLISPSGSVGSSFAIHDNVSDVGGVCGLAFGNGSFVVTYMRRAGANDNGDPLSRVYGRTISTTGVVGAELSLSPSFASCGAAINGGLASDGTTFLAAWAVQDSATAAEGVAAQARTITTSGTLGAVHNVRNSSVDARMLSVAARASGGWAVGMAELVNQATGDFDSYVQLLAADGSPTGALITIDNSATPVVGTVSEWENGFVVLLIERPGNASTQVVRLRRYDTANTPTGSDLLVAETTGGKPPYALAIAGQSRIYIVIEFFTPISHFLDFDEDSGDVRGVWVRP